MKLFGTIVGALSFLIGLGFTLSIARSDSPLWERLISMVFTLPLTAMGALVVFGLLGWLPEEWDKWLKSINAAATKKPAGRAGDELIQFNKRAAMLDLQIGAQNSFDSDVANPPVGSDAVIKESAAPGSHKQKKEPA